MGKATIKTYLQCSLLAGHLYGIIAILWRYDLYQRNGTYVDTGILVGVPSRNNTIVIEKDSENFIRHLELGEDGYDLDEHDVYKLQLWPKGIIPYFIDAVHYDRDYRDNLRRMLMEINYLSGIHFQELMTPPANEKARYVLFINQMGSTCTQSAGLTSTQFTNHGVQKVVLGYNSLSNGDMYGFVLAVAGIAPQNNAPNRDLFITVNKENILSEKLHLFDVLKADEWLYHDLAYDYGSASHFRYHEYTKNGYATLKPKLDVPEAMGYGFTFYDVLKMRRTYNYISNKKFKKVPDPSKLSYMYMTTAYPGQKTTQFPEDMNFGNPDDPKSKYGEGKHDDDEPGHKPSKSTSKSPRDKHHKYTVDNPDSTSSDEKKYYLEDSGHHVKAKFDEDDKNKYDKGVPRPLPNKYLGLSGDDQEHDVEEYRPKHMKLAEVLTSEDIDVYFSDSSRERRITKTVKIHKHKRPNKQKKINNRVHLNI